MNMHTLELNDELINKHCFFDLYRDGDDYIIFSAQHNRELDFIAISESLFTRYPEKRVFTSGLLKQPCLSIIKVFWQEIIQYNLVEDRVDYFERYFGCDLLDFFEHL